MTDQLPLRVRPADAWAALRIISDGAKAAADIIRDEYLAPAAEAIGASTFKTPFGKAYTQTTDARVEILTSADLRAWLAKNLPVDPRETGEGWFPSIIPEHQEDTFDEHQFQRALSVFRRAATEGSDAGDEELVRDILRAAFPPRPVPSRIAPWVIPYLTQRAKIEVDAAGVRGPEEVSYVVDSETGEEWPWATAVPEKVEWRARLSDESKADAAGIILGQVSDFAVLVGVKEIGQ